MQKAKKDYLTMLSVREIRLEAKKSSIHLYSRINKRELVDLILKDQKRDLIEENSNSELKFPPIIKKCPDAVKLNGADCGSGITAYTGGDVCKFKETYTESYNWDGITNADCD